MKAYGGVDVQLLSLLTFAQDGDEWSTSCPNRLTRGEKAPQCAWNRRLTLKIKSSSITGDRTTIFLLSNLLPGHFTDDAVAAQILENSNLEMFLFSKHTLRPLLCCMLRTFGPIPLMAT
jgi:hypothetical protein